MKLSQFLLGVPLEIIEALEKEFSKLESRFARRDWGPAELDGGRFAEAILRYLEWKSTKVYTPIGKQLARLDIIREIENNSSIADGVRFHVRRCAELLLDVRNKRDVGHLGNEVDVNEMDSRLVKRLASWSLAEIIREEGHLSPVESQNVVDKLSTKSLSLIEEIGGELVVVATNLSATEQALVALYEKAPSPINIGVLQKSTKYRNSTNFKVLMARESSKGIVHIIKDEVQLTNKGVAWVEKHVDLALKI